MWGHIYAHKSDFYPSETGWFIYVRVEEISGVAFMFNQKNFKVLYQDTGIDLENIVYITKTILTILL